MDSGNKDSCCGSCVIPCSIRLTRSRSPSTVSATTLSVSDSFDRTLCNGEDFQNENICDHLESKPIKESEGLKVESQRVKAINSATTVGAKQEKWARGVTLRDRYYEKLGLIPECFVGKRDLGQVTIASHVSTTTSARPRAGNANRKSTFDATRLHDDPGTSGSFPSALSILMSRKQGRAARSIKEQHSEHLLRSSSESRGDPLKVQREIRVQRVQQPSCSSLEVIQSCRPGDTKVRTRCVHNTYRVVSWQRGSL